MTFFVLHFKTILFLIFSKSLVHQISVLFLCSLSLELNSAKVFEFLAEVVLYFMPLICLIQLFQISFSDPYVLQNVARFSQGAQNKQTNKTYQHNILLMVSIFLKGTIYPGTQPSVFFYSLDHSLLTSWSPSSEKNHFFKVFS